MVSSGTSMNFAYYFAGKPYALAGSRHRIRSLGIAADDHVYAWLSDGKAQSGMSINLSQYRAPYAYSVPPAAPGTVDPESWYYGITLQNLLDHRSGFQRSGDMDGH